MVVYGSVQESVRYWPGVVSTEAGRANGTTNTTESNYDGYAECVRTEFDPSICNVNQLMDYFFEIIDPYSKNKQGLDVGPKYRTGVYSEHEKHLVAARKYIDVRVDSKNIEIEVKPLLNYVKSDMIHQDRSG